MVDCGKGKCRGEDAGTDYWVQARGERGVEGRGGALGVAVVSGFGFDPRLGAQTERGTFGVLLGFPVLPAVMTLLTVPIIWRFPINRRRQQIIVKRLARREAASS